MNDHHLILGSLKDFLTGREITDTHDERYRQKIAQILVNEKGYDKKDIKAGFNLTVKIRKKKAVLCMDFLVLLNGKTSLLVKYGPGSIITRHRPALAASRLIEHYQIPYVVVTNGVEADVLDGESGKVIGSGLAAIPGKKELVQLAAKMNRPPIPDEKKEKESRILYAFEIDGSCPCDSSICRIE